MCACVCARACYIHSSMLPHSLWFRPVVDSSISCGSYIHLSVSLARLRRYKLLCLLDIDRILHDHTCVHTNAVPDAVSIRAISSVRVFYTFTADRFSALCSVAGVTAHPSGFTTFLLLLLLYPRLLLSRLLPPCTACYLLILRAKHRTRRDVDAIAQSRTLN